MLDGWKDAWIDGLMHGWMEWCTEDGIHAWIDGMTHARHENGWLHRLMG